MADPDWIGPPNRRMTASVVRRPVRVLTQTLGVAELAVGPNTISGVASMGPHPGTPTVGLLVSLLTDPAMAKVKETTSGVGGTFNFINIPAGRYQLLISDPTQMYRSKVVHIEIP